MRLSQKSSVPQIQLRSMQQMWRNLKSRSGGLSLQSSAIYREFAAAKKPTGQQVGDRRIEGPRNQPFNKLALDVWVRKPYWALLRLFCRLMFWLPGTESRGSLMRATQRRQISSKMICDGNQTNANSEPAQSTR